MTTITYQLLCLRRKIRRQERAVLDAVCYREELLKEYRRLMAQMRAEELARDQAAAVAQAERWLGEGR